MNTLVTYVLVLRAGATRTVKGSSNLSKALILDAVSGKVLQINLH